MKSASKLALRAANVRDVVTAFVGGRARKPGVRLAIFGVAPNGKSFTVELGLPEWNSAPVIAYHRQLFGIAEASKGIQVWRYDEEGRSELVRDEAGGEEEEEGGGGPGGGGGEGGGGGAGEGG